MSAATVMMEAKKYMENSQNAGAPGSGMQMASRKT